MDPYKSYEKVSKMYLWTTLFVHLKRTTGCSREEVAAIIHKDYKHFKHAMNVLDKKSIK